MRYRTLQAFIDSDHFNRTEWIKEFGVRIYVRKPSIALHSADLELANMEADKPGKGGLTKFLDKYEGQYTFLLENVVNERLLAYFLRRGYRQLPSKKTFILPVLITPSCWHYYDGKRPEKV